MISNLEKMMQKRKSLIIRCFSRFYFVFEVALAFRRT